MIFFSENVADIYGRSIIFDLLTIKKEKIFKLIL